MYVREVTYEDYDGNKRTEEFSFHMNKAEITKWMTTSGDYTIDKLLERLRVERNGRKIMEIFEELIHISYGRKSPDGRRFEKNEELWLDFKETEAYSIIFTDLVYDANKAAEFVNGIMPKDIVEAIQKVVEENPEGIPAEYRDYLPVSK